jgi:phosphatidylglycerophosphate synthase
MAAPAIARPAPAPKGRIPELEDPFNRYLYHPLAARLARLLVPTGIVPNAVSVAGAVCVFIAAWVYVEVAWPIGVLLGLAFHMAWHVVDGADGDLARLTGRASPRGEMVDGLCDHAAHVVLYVALAVILDDAIGIWAWALGWAAGISHAFQTAHCEGQRRNYLWWVYGISWIKHAEASGDRMFLARGPFGAVFVWLTRLYLRAARWMAPYAGRLDRLAAEAAGDPLRAVRLRRKMRRSLRASLVFEKALGAPPRTIMLGLSMLAGSPLWHLLGEAVLLNLVLGASILQHNAVQRRLSERLA